MRGSTTKYRRVFRGALLLLGAAVALLSLVYVVLPGLAVDLFPSRIFGKKKDGRVHIEYWEKWTLFEADAMKTVVERFNRSQNRIHVEYRTISQIGDRFLISVAGKHAPDVAGLQTYMIPNFASRGALLPLDGLAREFGIREEDYLPVFWDLGIYNDALYALPSTPATIALHYNKRLLREAGFLGPPRTLEELDQYAEKLTTYDEQGRIKVLGFSPSLPGYYHWLWGYWFGGMLWDGQDAITVNAQENIEAFVWIQNYARRFGYKKLDAFKASVGKLSSPQNPFISERVAMEIEGVWMFNYITRSQNKDLEWGVATFPSSRPGLDGVTLADCDQLVIPAECPHPREAFEFIAFVQKQENMEALCLEQRKFPPLKSVSPDFWDRHPHPYIRFFYDAARSENARSIPKIPVFQQIKDEMNSAFSDVWTLNQTPEQALDAVQKRIERAWEEEKIRMSRRQTHNSGQE